MKKLSKGKRIRRLVDAVLVLLILLAQISCPAVCAEGSFSFEEDFAADGFGGTIERYLSENKLSERNITIGWQDIESGEEWYLGADIFREGASTYKLPLCMLYADWVSEGIITREDKVGAYTVEQAVREALVNSSNNAAYALRNGVSDNHVTYRTAIAANCGLDAEALPSGYYTANQFSPRYLIGTLRTLWDNSDKYEWILEYMKQAQPNGYFSLYRGDCEVAHKIGNALGYICDTGIIYTSRPFLLTVMSSDVPDADRVLGEIARIAMDYAEYLSEKNAVAQEPEPTPLPEPSATPNLPDGIILSAQSLSLRRGEKADLKALFVPEGTESRPLVWMSSDETVACVDGTGTVTAMGGGKAVISCTSEDGNLNAECSVEVRLSFLERLFAMFR